MQTARACWCWMVVAAVFAAAGSNVDGREPRRATVRLESDPAGALVSVHEQPPTGSFGERVVAGETPLTQKLDFGRQRRLWLELERRGYVPRVIEVTPSSGFVSVELEPVDGVREMPSIESLVVLEPEINAVERRFSSEGTSDELSAALAEAFQAAVGEKLQGRIEMNSHGSGGEVSLRSIRREVRTVARLLDPIRLPYLSVAPRLESRAARDAVRQLGELHGADAVLVLTGKQNRETGGMKAGKIGVMVAGTAASYASAYGRAAANGDELFTYTVYLPSAAEGLAMTAVLVHCASGEILWMNMGVWPPIARDADARAQAAVADLLAQFPAPVNDLE